MSFENSDSERDSNSASVTGPPLSAPVADACGGVCGLLVVARVVDVDD